MDLTNKIEGLNHQKIKKDKKLILVSLYDPASQALRLLSTFLKKKALVFFKFILKIYLQRSFPIPKKNITNAGFETGLTVEIGYL